MRSGLLAGVVLLAASCTPFWAASTAPTPVAQASPSHSPSPPPLPSPTPQITPQPSPISLPSASPFVYLQILDYEYGTVVVQTDGGAVCNLTVTMDDGTVPQGVINPQVANWDGQVTWVYRQAPYDGHGHDVVACTRDGLTATQSADFVVDPSA